MTSPIKLKRGQTNDPANTDIQKANFEKAKNTGSSQSVGSRVTPVPDTQVLPSISSLTKFPPHQTKPGSAKTSTTTVQNKPGGTSLKAVIQSKASLKRDHTSDTKLASPHQTNSEPELEKKSSTSNASRFTVCKELQEVCELSLDKKVNKDPLWNPVVMLIKCPIKTDSKGKICFSGTSLPRKQLERIRRDEMKAHPGRRSSSSRSIKPPKRFMDEQYWMTQIMKVPKQKTEERLVQSLDSCLVDKKKQGHHEKQNGGIHDLDKNTESRKKETNNAFDVAMTPPHLESISKYNKIKPALPSSDQHKDIQLHKDMPVLEKVKNTKDVFIKQYGKKSPHKTKTKAILQLKYNKSLSLSDKRSKLSRSALHNKHRSKRDDKTYEMLSKSFDKLGLSSDQRMQESMEGLSTAQNTDTKLVTSTASYTCTSSARSLSHNGSDVPSTSMQQSEHSPQTHSNNSSTPITPHETTHQSKKRSPGTRKRRGSNSSDDWAEARGNQQCLSHKRKRSLEEEESLDKTYGFRKRERISYDDGDFPDVGFDILCWSDEDEDEDVSLQNLTWQNNKVESRSKPQQVESITKHESIYQTKEAGKEIPWSPQRKRGRPPGSKNKNKNSKLLKSRSQFAKNAENQTSPSSFKPHLSFTVDSMLRNGIDLNRSPSKPVTTGSKPVTTEPKPVTTGSKPVTTRSCESLSVIATSHSSYYGPIFCRTTMTTPRISQSCVTNSYSSEQHNNSSSRMGDLPPVVNGQHSNHHDNSSEATLYRDAMWTLGYFSPRKTKKEGSPPRCWSPSEDIGRSSKCQLSPEIKDEMQHNHKPAPGRENGARFHLPGHKQEFRKEKLVLRGPHSTRRDKKICNGSRKEVNSTNKQLTTNSNSETSKSMRGATFGTELLGKDSVVDSKGAKVTSKQDNKTSYADSEVIRTHKKQKTVASLKDGKDIRSSSYFDTDDCTSSDNLIMELHDSESSGQTHSADTDATVDDVSTSSVKLTPKIATCDGFIQTKTPEESRVGITRENYEVNIPKISSGNTLGSNIPHLATHQDSINNSGHTKPSLESKDITPRTNDPRSCPEVKGQSQSTREAFTLNVPKEKGLTSAPRFLGASGSDIDLDSSNSMSLEDTTTLPLILDTGTDTSLSPSPALTQRKLCKDDSDENLSLKTQGKHQDDIASSWSESEDLDDPSFNRSSLKESGVTQRKCCKDNSDDNLTLKTQGKHQDDIASSWSESEDLDDPSFNRSSLKESGVTQKKCCKDNSDDNLTLKTLGKHQDDIASSWCKLDLDINPSYKRFSLKESDLSYKSSSGAYQMSYENISSDDESLPKKVKEKQSDNITKSRSESEDPSFKRLSPKESVKRSKSGTGAHQLKFENLLSDEESLTKKVEDKHQDLINSNRSESDLVEPSAKVIPLDKSNIESKSIGSLQIKCEKMSSDEETFSGRPLSSDSYRSSLSYITPGQRKHLLSSDDEEKNEDSDDIYSASHGSSSTGASLSLDMSQIINYVPSISPTREVLEGSFSSQGRPSSQLEKPTAIQQEACLQEVESDSSLTCRKRDHIFDTTESQKNRLDEDTRHLDSSFSERGQPQFDYELDGRASQMPTVSSGSQSASSSDEVRPTLSFSMGQNRETCVRSDTQDSDNSNSFSQLVCPETPSPSASISVSSQSKENPASLPTPGSSGKLTPLINISKASNLQCKVKLSTSAKSRIDRHIAEGLLRIQRIQRIHDSRKHSNLEESDIKSSNLDKVNIEPSILGEANTKLSSLQESNNSNSNNKLSLQKESDAKPTKLDSETKSEPSFWKNRRESEADDEAEPMELDTSQEENKSQGPFQMSSPDLIEKSIHNDSGSLAPNDDSADELITTTSKQSAANHDDPLHPSGQTSTEGTFLSSPISPTHDENSNESHFGDQDQNISGSQPLIIEESPASSVPRSQPMERLDKVVKPVRESQQTDKPAKDNAKQVQNQTHHSYECSSEPAPVQSQTPPELSRLTPSREENSVPEFTTTGVEASSESSFKIWTPIHHPPSFDIVQASLQEYGLPQLRHKRVFCKNPDDAHQSRYVNPFKRLFSKCVWKKYFQENLTCSCRACYIFSGPPCGIIFSENSGEKI